MTILFALPVAEDKRGALQGVVGSESSAVQGYPAKVTDKIQRQDTVSFV